MELFSLAENNQQCSFMLFQNQANLNALCLGRKSNIQFSLVSLTCALILGWELLVLILTICC